MRVGTKSLLFGAHQFIMHPVCIALAWFRLFGLRTVYWRMTEEDGSVLWAEPLRVYWWHPMLWLSFFIHDLGYWGSRDMDGYFGESHADKPADFIVKKFWLMPNHWKWSWFLQLHSRYSARRRGVRPSPLAAADKMAHLFMPPWLYVTMTRATGEIREYQSVEKHAEAGGYLGERVSRRSFKEDVEWFMTIRSNLHEWSEKFVRDNYGFRE